MARRKPRQLTDEERKQILAGIDAAYMFMRAMVDPDGFRARVEQIETEIDQATRALEENDGRTP